MESSSPPGTPRRLSVRTRTSSTHTLANDKTVSMGQVMDTITDVTNLNTPAAEGEPSILHDEGRFILGDKENRRCLSPTPDSPSSVSTCGVSTCFGSPTLRPIVVSSLLVSVGTIDQYIFLVNSSQFLLAKTVRWCGMILTTFPWPRYVLILANTASTYYFCILGSYRSSGCVFSSSLYCFTTYHFSYSRGRSLSYAAWSCRESGVRPKLFDLLAISDNRLFRNRLRKCATELHKWSQDRQNSYMERERGRQALVLAGDNPPPENAPAIELAAYWKPQVRSISLL